VGGQTISNTAHIKIRIARTGPLQCAESPEFGSPLCCMSTHEGNCIRHTSTSGQRSAHCSMLKFLRFS